MKQEATKSVAAHADALTGVQAARPRSALALQLKAADYEAGAALLSPKGLAVDPSKMVVNAAITTAWADAKVGYGYCLPNVAVSVSEWDRGAPSGNVQISLRRGRRIPDGKIDIASANDAAITADTWKAVADDLTPDGNGRAPRKRYISSRLAEAHETFHAKDYMSVAVAYGQKQVKQAAKLADRSALAKAFSKHGQVARETMGDLIEFYAGGGRRAPSEVLEDTNEEAYLARPGEARAFADGLPRYQALADAIRARGPELEAAAKRGGR